MRLAEILDETNDDNITKNVSRFLHRIGNTLNELKAVKSDSINKYWASRCFDDSGDLEAEWRNSRA